jgi:thymidylate synthase
MAKREVEQASIRGDGKLRIAPVEANCLAEATHKAILGCYERGIRVETPKQKPGMTLGYDADMLIQVNNPDSEPKIYMPGIHDSDIGVMQYILEVTHGIHNHWKKNAEHPEWWGYTYNERFVEQMPFIFQRIEHDWKEKGRISGRDYQFSIWRAGEDIILEQPDAPCFQRGQFRFVDNSEGEIVMSYQTDWRSRDLLKAWNENNLGQIELMKLAAAKVSDITGQPIKLGSYIDRSSSLHLYGLYFDRDGLEKQIKQMRGYENDEDLINKIRDSDVDLFDSPNWKKKIDMLLKPVGMDRFNVWAQEPEFLNHIKALWHSAIYKKHGS